jgi:hypothetical protein
MVFVMQASEKPAQKLPLSGRDRPRQLLAST